MTKIEDNDGVNHINIYSNGRTELGRMLSHFAPIGLMHPVHGCFNSMEGFWFYISTGCIYNDLRDLVGYEAKKFGRDKIRRPCENFKELIQEGNRCKIEQHEELRIKFIQSTLPFDHYYLMGVRKIYVKQIQYQWLIDMFEQLRKEMRGS